MVGRGAIRRGTIRVLLFILLPAVFLPGPFFGGGVKAEGISGYMEHTYNNGKQKSEDSTGVKTETKTDSFIQQYSLALDRRLYPNLGLMAGGFYERNSMTMETEGQENSSTVTKIKPYVNLRLRTPLYQADVGYDRREEEVKSSQAPTTTTIRDSYVANLGWRPDDFPLTNFRFFRSETHDKDRQIQDSTDDIFQFTSEYRPIGSLFLKYTGSFEDFQDHLKGNEIRTESHEGRVTFADQFWRKRIALSSEYYINYIQTEISTSGVGDIASPLSPVFGLSAISDNTVIVVMEQNPALIDGNLGDGVGINLGLPPPGGDARRRHVGMDFVNATALNTLLVWVDRDLPPDIASSFSWDIYTSSDNINWQLRQTVSPAIFGPFLNRFEIHFVTVTTRYIRVVTRPLSPTVPFSSGFPIILVTEVQAVLRTPAASAQKKASSTNHRYNLGMRVKILDAPSLYYEMSYFFIKSGTLPSNYDLSNGLSLSHPLSKVFSVSARVLREDGHSQDGEKVAYRYSASIVAVPLETLQHTLLYSGGTEKTGEERTDSNYVAILNTAHLYEGVDANLGLTKGIQTRGNGEKADTTQITGGVTLVPHRSMTINLSYFETSRKTSGGSLSTGTQDTLKSGEASISYTPFPTLYLFGSYHVERKTATPNSSTLNYAVSWSPFPGGTLNFNFNYNETLRSENNERDRTITPFIRWNISRRMYSELTYQDLRTESNTLKTRNNVASARMRVSF